MHDPTTRSEKSESVSNLSGSNSEFKKDLISALVATFFFGAAGGIFVATYNNYLSDVHSLGAEMRGWLEFPRELPGFLMMFVAGGMLLFFRETKMAAIAMFFTAAGAIGLGYASDGFVMLVVWTVIWSLGDHIIFTVEGPIGLRMAAKGGEGKRLGQFGGFRNFGTITGVGLIFILARFWGDQYSLFYLIAACAALIAGLFYIKIKLGKTDKRSHKFVYKKKYKVFYAISALFGIRKQIFLAFGTWVLVSLHDVSVSTIALLYFIAATLGVILRPLLGEVIDWLGERFVLSADEILLALICLTYAFATDLLPAPYNLYVLFGAYIFDSILFALRVARTTYLKKIADSPEDITPSISLGITIDHIVAMSLPVLSGYIWERFGYQWVFILAAAIAVGGFFVCLQIKIPKEAEELSQGR